MSAGTSRAGGRDTGVAIWAALADHGALSGLGLRPPHEIEAITGHASTRRFYRVRPAGDALPRTVVLVVYPATDDDGVERYVRSADWFGDAGVRVPRIYEAGSRSLVVEDGGSRLLDGVDVGGARRRYYRQAVDAIVAVHRHGHRAGAPEGAGALDAERLRTELEFMERHTIRGWLGATADTGARERCYERVVAAIDRLPTEVQHRDYHARNLLVTDERLLVLDFQDALPGPVFYDLASLLWDNYCDLEHALVAELAARFRARAASLQLETTADLPVPDRPPGLPGAARQAFCLVALQRSLKALGTFGYQVEVGNRGYAAYAPRTWGHVRRALGQLGWRSFSEALSCCERLTTAT